MLKAFFWVGPVGTFALIYSMVSGAHPDQMSRLAGLVIAFLVTGGLFGLLGVVLRVLGIKV